MIYLSPGDYRTFPSEYVQQRNGLRNRFEFSTFKLWEHTERIRSGELAVLAPLLVLCEDAPVEETVLQEQSLIRAADVEDDLRVDLIRLAVTVASRYLARDFVFNLFREDMEMLKEAGIVEEWLAESEARGRLLSRRETVLIALEGRFGSLPPSVVRDLEQADVETCDRIVRNIGNAQSLGDLGLE